MGKRLLLVGTMIAALAATAPGAWADGDPASDVLATQSLFLPQDAGIPSGQQAQLTSLLASAGRRGFPIRAALIASPADLGSVGVLWRRPQTYARFLGEELGLIYRGPVLVAMPNGFGLYVPSRPAAALPASLTGVPAAGSGPRLATSTMVAVQRLAAAAGHPLPAPSGGPQPGGGSDTLVPWLVFAGGLVLVGLAWGASLRARPLGSGSERPAGV